MDAILLFSLSKLLLMVAIALLIPMGILFVESAMASLTPLPPRSQAVLAESSSLAVLIPAHNEAEGIAPVLRSLQAQLRPQDRLLVIADNCTDETAAIARQEGAEVIERQDEQRRGKGYALDFGLQALAAHPPNILVMMDADGYVTEGSLQQLAAQSLQTGRPSQAVYLFETPNPPTSKSLVSAFAIKLKNWIRPLGLLKLGLPSLLFGTGMAFPWSVINKVDLASGHIVEDMKLGFDLAIAGYPPLLCPQVRVIGQLPQSQDATVSQRTRWEHGHLQVLRSYWPRLLGQALKQGRGDLLALALDLSIPPLSLLVMLWLIALFVTFCAHLIGLGSISLTLVLVSGGLLFLAIGLAWWRFARIEVPLRHLLSVVGYMLGKIPLYLKFLVKPQAIWVRTDRSSSSEK